MRPALADLLDLHPHPEGGWYRQTWASPESVILPDGRERVLATLILFLLPVGESSSWHRVASEEVWLVHRGSLVLELGGDGEAPAVDSTQTTVLGADLAPGEVAQTVVPAHVWQHTVPGPVDALLSCLVSPGFDFDDFELSGQDGDPAVQRASAGPDESPIDPSAPTNPA